MATNDILPFCPTDTGTNLLTQAAYLASSSRVDGNQPGVASSMLNNKAIRQSAFISSQFAQYISNITGNNVNDDGNTTTLLATITTAFAQPPASQKAQNLGIAATVATSALTVALKQFDGSTDATAILPVNIAFRSATAATGGFTVVSVTGALSLVVPSTATLGQTSNALGQIYVYALNNAGTVELAISSTVFDDGARQTTTALSTSATSFTTLYSTTARTNVPIRLIGRMSSAQVTAGTWAAVPSQISLLPFAEQVAYRLGSVSTFKTTGSWSRPSGCRAVRVRVQGGGGAGGGAPLTTAGQNSCGAGGGGGGYDELFITSGLTDTVTATVGAGGVGASGTTGGTGVTSSFGSYVTASGGVGGGSTSSSTSAASATGGNGGVGASGTLNSNGGVGGGSFKLATGAFVMSGQGGDSYFGGGAGGVGGTSGAGAGSIALAYGAGGSGGINGATGNAAVAGGNGAPGIIIVEEYY